MLFTPAKIHECTHLVFCPACVIVLYIVCTKNKQEEVRHGRDSYTGDGDYNRGKYIYI